MGKLANILKAWAEQHDDNPDFQLDDEDNRAVLKFTSGNGDFSYRAFYHTREKSDVVELFLYAPITAPEKSRITVAELLVRANLNAFCGRIDLDMSDGELRFRAGFDIEGGQLTPEMLNNLLSIGNGLLDQYLPAIAAVIYAGTSPADAVAQARDEGEANQPAPEPEPELPPQAWDRIPGADLLQAWAHELRTACAMQEADEWRDVGHAVVLVNDDVSHCRDVLRRVAQAAEMRFVVIETEDVTKLPPRAAFTKLAPALMFLEPGVWLQSRQEDMSDDDAEVYNRLQHRLVQWISTFDVAHPVVICTMVYKLGDMSSVLDGTRRFDRYFALPPKSHVARGEEFIEQLGPERCGPSITAAPAKLGKFLADGFARSGRHEMALLYLRRLHKRTKKPIQFLDLMHISTHGFAEEGTLEASSEEIRRQVAAHEAGHAAMAILDSAGRNVPDYCSIVPGVGFKGVVAESVGYHQSLGDRTTYADFRHDIRICLAGRAAEELTFGPARISNGAQGDLENAWKRTHRAFARWGFAPQMESANATSANLAVIVGDPTHSESQYIEALVRQFMVDEYAVVLKYLADNQAFLNAIADRLLWDPIVDQAELTEICRTHLKLDI